MDSVVKLNVGGVLYTTVRSTLIKYPNSTLASMFNGNLSSLTRDESGNYFIDRNGEFFGIILDFLRDGSLILPNKFDNFPRLKAESNFYKIQPLIVQLENVIRSNEDVCLTLNELPVAQVQTDRTLSGSSIDVHLEPDKSENDTCSLDIVRKTITNLSLEGQWRALRSFLRQIADTDITKSVLAREVNLRGLAETNEDWSFSLLYELLELGAEIQTLRDDEKPVIFNIVRLAVLAPSESATFNDILERFLSDEDVQAIDEIGQNAWDYASDLAQGKTEDCINVLRVLKQKGLERWTKTVAEIHTPSRHIPAEEEVTESAVRDILKELNTQDTLKFVRDETSRTGDMAAESQPSPKQPTADPARSSQRTGQLPVEAKNSQKPKACPKQDEHKPKSSSQLEPTCNQCENRYSHSTLVQAPLAVKIENLLEILREETHPSVTHDDWASKSSALLTKLLSQTTDEDTIKQVRNIPTEYYQKLLLDASLESWDLLARLVRPVIIEERGKDLLGPVVTQLDLCDYTTSCSASSDILKILLDAGLSPTKRNKRGERPLQAGARSGQHEFVKLMVDYVTDSKTGGESPLHAALQGALRKDGSDEILGYLLALHRKNPKKYRFLSPVHARDGKGGTLLHAVAKVNREGKERLKELTAMLVNCGIDKNSKDNKDKIAMDYVRPSDNRYDLLRAGTAANDPKKDASIDKTIPAPESQQSRRKKESDLLCDEVVSNITKLEKMPRLTKDNVTVESEVEDSDSELEENEDDSNAQHSTEEDNEDIHTTASEKHERETGSRDGLRLGGFRNLPWPVEVSSKAWKEMTSKRITQNLREDILMCIRELGRGSNARTLHRMVKVPDSLKSGTEFELKKIEFSKAKQVIIWEKAITPVLNDQKGCHEGLYTEVIRIWAIALDRGRINRNASRIARAIIRGKSSIIERNLQPLNKEEERYTENGMQYPIYYTEKLAESGSTKWHQPASHRQNIYSIEKFYHFNRYMVEYLVDGISEDGDFPFKPTPQEAKYIMLEPEPKASVLVLGRSGTGKTTCCLYRLWTRFKAHWKKHPVGSEPAIPRKSPLPEMEQEAEEDETDKRKENVQPVEEPDEMSLTAVHDHLHQVFVTRNSGLVADVRKEFKKFCNARKETRSFGGTLIVPDKFQSVEDQKFPLFLNIHHLLIALDNSLPDPYFERDSSGNMIESIDGWRVSDVEDDSYVTVIQEDTKRKEVTYEIFHDEFWPKFGKLRQNFHPALVWMEIVSYIKGSFGALYSEKGYLTLEEYEQIGQKRAPTFRGNRNVIYAIFLRYQDQCRWKGYFDEADVVYHIYQRLVKYDHRSKWAIHEIYVDEVQDFTQAQLCLLIQMCQDPNDLFFTGDTAQSITRGVAFRFCDLRSLFHELNEKEKSRTAEVARRLEENGLPQGKNQAIAIRTPDENKLLYNYRSHDGVIRLAASVIDLLARYFSESFDLTEPDRALFDGPRPLVFDLDSVEDLVRKLRGGKSDSEGLNLGHEQCIIVQNEQARENMREEFQNCQILTVIRTKGLEYDDIILYNFFKDSEVGETWRVVAEYLAELRQEKVLKEVPEKDRSRPLKFDPDKHKILNTELKRLYTAITRARNKVIIYDEDTETRKPVLEYFRALDLVTIVSGESHPKTDFQTHSTPKEWRTKGREYFRTKNYDLAAQCFKRGKNSHMTKICEAYHKIAKVRELRSEADRSAAYFEAAASVLRGETGEYKLYVEAARCLQGANQPQLAARVYKCLGKLKEAAELFDKSGNTKAAIECYEEIGYYDEVVDIHLRSNFSEQTYNEAIAAWSRYAEKLKKSEKDADRKLTLEAHRPKKEEKHLHFKLAHHKIAVNDISEACQTLENLHWSAEDIAELLVEKGKRSEAVNILKSKENFVEVAKMYRKTGDYTDAIDTLKHPKCEDTEAVIRELADCYVLHCRVYLEARKNENQIKVKVGSDVDETVTEYKENLDAALESYRSLGMRQQQAECLLLKGILLEDVASLQKSQLEYRNTSIEIGEIHAYIHLMKLSGVPMSGLYFLLKSLSRALTTIDDAHSEVHHDVLRFYGAEEAVEYGSLIHSLGANIGPIDKNSAEILIQKDLKRLAVTTIESVLRKSKHLIQKATPCSEMEECQDGKCPCVHRKMDLVEREMLIKCHVEQMTLHGIILDYFYKKKLLMNFLKRKEREGLINWQCPMELIRELFLMPPNYATDTAHIDRVMKPLMWNKNRGDFEPRKWLMMPDDKSVPFLINIASNTTDLMKTLYGSLMSGEYVQNKNLDTVRRLLAAMNKYTENTDQCNFQKGTNYWNIFEFCARSLFEHYDCRNPFLGHKTFTTFLNLLAHRSAKCATISPQTEMIMPLLEFHLTRAILIYQKGQRNGCAYIPQDYVRTVEVFDRCFRTSATTTIIHQFVIKSQRKINSVRNDVAELLRVITGMLKKSFDLLTESISSRNAKIQARVIVFILVCFINTDESVHKIQVAGKEQSVSLLEVIMCRMQQASENKGLKPLISELLRAVLRAQSYAHITQTLQQFLESENSKLLQWKTGAGFSVAHFKDYANNFPRPFISYDPDRVSHAYQLYEETMEGTEAVEEEATDDREEIIEPAYEEPVAEDLPDDPTVRDDGCIACGEKSVENTAETEWKRHHIKSEKHVKAKTQYDLYMGAVEPLSKRVKENTEEVRRLYSIVKAEEPDIRIRSLENLVTDFKEKQKEIEKKHEWSALQQLRDIAANIDMDHKVHKKVITGTNTYKDHQARQGKDSIAAPPTTTTTTTVKAMETTSNQKHAMSKTASTEKLAMTKTASTKKPATKKIAFTGQSPPTRQTTSWEGTASLTEQKPAVVGASSMDGTSGWTANNQYYKDNVYGQRIVPGLEWNEPFRTMQLQGRTNMCGVCALNNLLQFEDYFRNYLELTPMEMDQLADDIWLQLISDHGGDSTAAEGMRSTLGDYNIEVLQRAVMEKGFRLERLTGRNRDEIDLQDDEKKWKILVKVPGRDHYVSYNFKFGMVDKFDSLMEVPQNMIQARAAEEIYQAMTADDGGAWLLLKEAVHD